MKDVLDNPDKPWEWNGLSENPNLTLKDIANNPDLEWNWSNLSHNTFGINKSFTLKQSIEASKQKVAVYKEELFAKAWHPDRFTDWCLDAEEHKEYV